MAAPPLPIIADDDSTRDDGLLAQVALAQLLVEFQQAQTAQPLGVKDRRVKQVELSLGYRMLQYRWNTSIHFAVVRKAHHAGSPACSRGLRSSLTEDGEFHQAPLWGLLVSGGIGTWQAMLDLNEIMSSPFAAADQLVTGLDSWHPSWRAIQRHSYKKLLTNERGKSEEEAASAKCPAAPTFLHTAAKVPAPLILQGATLQI
ncbi:hypothetical protein KXX11_007174 [Aspergillus fumigatus]|nr:hypothetical protein KXX11_007174 [Aspergillus fumigatus]